MLLSAKYYLSFFLTAILFCQMGQAQLSGFGIGAGGTASTFNYGNQINSSSGIDNFDNGDKVGGTGGIQFDFDLASEFVKLSPELFIIQNGSREFYNDFTQFQGDLVERSINLDYVGFYLPVKFYAPIDNGYNITDQVFHGLIAEISGFFDYAMNGSILGNNSIDEKVSFAKDVDRFDVGFSLSAGIIMNGFFLKFGYQKGIKNIEFSNAAGGTDDQNYLINNRGFTLSIGFAQKIE